MEAQKLEEAEYRRQMMEKFAADDRIEQMNAQKRRMKQLGEGEYHGWQRFIISMRRQLISLM